MSTQRLCREIALQYLFQRGFNPDPQAPTNIPEFAQTLINGCIEHESDLKSTIEKASTRWSLDRIDPIDFHILCLAIFEMKLMKEPTPKAIAINEALDIAKKFSTQKSSKFINGILDALSKELP